METEILVDMRGAVVNGGVGRLSGDRDGDRGAANDYVVDCRRRWSRDCASVDAAKSEDLTVTRQTASPMSATATYWRDVVDNGDDKTTLDDRRRCESCNSDVSVTSLPESLASDDDDVAADSPPCKERVSWTPASTGNSFALARQPQGEMEQPGDLSAKSTLTSGHGGWSRDVVVDSAVRPPQPTAVGFSIVDILRPDFGKTHRLSEADSSRQKEAAAAIKRCVQSYPSPAASLLPSSLRRSLVHPYTAAAAFCAAAVAAAAAAGVQGAAVSTRREPMTESVQRPEALRQQVVSAPSSASAHWTRCVTSPRGDVTYHHVINNNNTKLCSRYACDDKDGGGGGGVQDAARQKPRRTRAEQTSPASGLRISTSVATAKAPATSRPDQPVLLQASPTPRTAFGASTNGGSGDVVDVEQQPPQPSDGRSSPSLAPLRWPAWVYCTRYSDRPSSGRQSKSRTHPRTHTHTHTHTVTASNTRNRLR